MVGASAPYTKRLWVRSPVAVHTGGSWLMFLSHMDISLSFSLFPPPHPPFSRSKIHQKIFPRVRIEKMKTGGCVWWRELVSRILPLCRACLWVPDAQLRQDAVRAQGRNGSQAGSRGPQRRPRCRGSQDWWEGLCSEVSGSRGRCGTPAPRLGACSRG